MSRLSKNANRSLRMESLEERQMMAGDVAVEMLGGELIIDGDSAGNAVMVSKLDDGGYQISGLWADGGMTKINGEYSTTVNDVNGIHVDLEGGNDSLYINSTRNGNDLVVKGDLNIHTGGDDDYVRILNTTVEGNVSIVTDKESSIVLPGWIDQPSGDDHVAIEGLIAHKDINISTGFGSDTVDFGAFFHNNYPSWNVVDTLTIDTGVGTSQSDTIDLDYVFAHESIDLDTGNGDDTIRTNYARAVTGIDIATHGGQDTVEIQSSDMEWNGLDWQASVWVDTGSGNDVVSLDDVDAHGQVVVLTGSGNDAVEMNDIHADSIFADLGKDTDALKITSSSAKNAYLYGGTSRGDNDSLQRLDNAFGTLYQDEWESLTKSSTGKLARRF